MSRVTPSFRNVATATLALGLAFTPSAGAQNGGAMTLPYAPAEPQVMLTTRVIAAQCIEGPTIPRQMVGVVADAMVGPMDPATGAAAEGGTLPADLRVNIGAAWQDAVRTVGFGPISALPMGGLSAPNASVHDAFTVGLTARDEIFQSMIPDETQLAIVDTGVFRLAGCPETLPATLREAIQRLPSPFETAGAGTRAPLRDRGPFIDV